MRIIYKYFLSLPPNLFLGLTYFSKSFWGRRAQRRQLRLYCHAKCCMGGHYNDPSRTRFIILCIPNRKMVRDPNLSVHVNTYTNASCYIIGGIKLYYGAVGVTQRKQPSNSKRSYWNGKAKIFLKCGAVEDLTTKRKTIELNTFAYL